MLETFAWIAATEDERQSQTKKATQLREQQLAPFALLAALILLLAWLLSRRRGA
jgi:hypothetical protein